MVYVLNKNGQPLMPTKRYGKVRRLLKSGQAVVIFIFGRRTSGYFDIRTLNGDKVNKGSISYKNLKFLQNQQSILIERQKVAA